MRPAHYVGLALIASMSLAASVQAQGKAGPRGATRIAAPIVVQPETQFRLSRRLSVRTNIAVREALPLAAVQYAGPDAPALLRLHTAILDLYPFGRGLRFSAGVGVDQGGGETMPAEHGGNAEALPVVTTAPAFTVGYGGSLKGPLNFAVDGGVRLHEVPRVNEASSPRLSNSGVNRAYPVVRFSLLRAF